MTVQTCSCHITSHTHTHTHRFFKNAFKKTRSPIRATALTTHMHRSTSSHPMSSWTCQAPHLLVIEEDFVKHVCIKAPPFFAPKLMLACTFMTVVQNHSLAIVAQFLSLRPTRPQRAMRTDSPPGCSSAANSLGNVVMDMQSGRFFIVQLVLAQTSHKGSFP